MSTDTKLKFIYSFLQFVRYHANFFDNHKRAEIESVHRQTVVVVVVAVDFES